MPSSSAPLMRWRRSRVTIPRSAHGVLPRLDAIGGVAIAGEPYGPVSTRSDHNRLGSFCLPGNRVFPEQQRIRYAIRARETVVLVEVAVAFDRFETELLDSLGLTCRSGDLLVSGGFVSTAAHCQSDRDGDGGSMQGQNRWLAFLMRAPLGLDRPMRSFDPQAPMRRYTPAINSVTSAGYPPQSVPTSATYYKAVTIRFAALESRKRPVGRSRTSCHCGSGGLG